MRPVIAILGFLAACAGPVDPVPDAQPAELGPACACDDLACIEAWVDEHLGCDLCAHVECGGDTIGVCVPCE
jgi:hypothetical protein